MKLNQAYKEANPGLRVGNSITQGHLQTWMAQASLALPRKLCSPPPASPCIHTVFCSFLGPWWSSGGLLHLQREFPLPPSPFLHYLPNPNHSTIQLSSPEMSGAPGPHCPVHLLPSPPAPAYPLTVCCSVLSPPSAVLCTHIS